MDGLDRRTDTIIDANRRGTTDDGKVARFLIEKKAVIDNE